MQIKRFKLFTDPIDLLFMKELIKKAWRMLCISRFIPHFIVYKFHNQRDTLKYEKDYWINVLRFKEKGNLGFFYLINDMKEYRNVFYLRIGFLGNILKCYIKESSTTFFNTPQVKIGRGLVLQHGFSSIINAKEIGQNCQIWQNVTIGLSESGTDKKPIIGNNVKICAGAIVLGKISIGDNVIIGAGSVVVKSVPDNAVVVGNPAYIIKRNGIKINEKL